MGLLDSITSILTGGISDVFRGESPFSAVIDQWGVDHSTNNWLKNLSSQMFSGGFDQLPRAYEKASKQDGFGNQLATFFDRAADPAGTIDYSTRKTGEYVPDDVSAVIETVGVPVASYLYGPGGAAAMSAISGKVRGRGDLQNWQNAGMAALMSYMGGGELGGAAPSGNVTTSGLLTAGGKGIFNIAKNEMLKAAMGKSDPKVEYGTNFIDMVGNRNYAPRTSKDFQGGNGTLKETSFTPTELPKLSEYGDSREKKIAEALTDEYKNYKLNDYMLYKADPEKLQDIIMKYT